MPTVAVGMYSPEDFAGQVEKSMSIKCGRFFVAAIVALICSRVAADVPGASPRTRRDFAKAMSQVKEEMPKAKVLALLGRPDDIRTQNDPFGIPTLDTKEVWRYGTSGHLTTATLGEVYIDFDDRVENVFGQGVPPDDLPEERQLRRLLDILGQVSSYNSAEEYNPRTVVRAVNALQPLGKKRALAVIDEFLRITSGYDDASREGVFLVLRTLFDVPKDPGYMPEMIVGAPVPDGPKDPKLLPRFPIVLEGDIPFLVVRGFNLGGRAQDPEEHVDYFRKHGKVRARPLVPTDKPFEAFDRFIKSPRWLFDPTDKDREESGESLLGNQLLRLLDSVYRTEPDKHGDLLPSYGDHADTIRRKILQDVSRLKLRWDPVGLRYTFLDGHVLAPPKIRQYRHEIWKLPLAGLDAEIVLQRFSPRYVLISATEHFDGGKKRPRAIVEVFDMTTRPCADAKAESIAEFRIGGPASASAGKGSTSTDSTTVELPDGATVQIRLMEDVIVDGKHFLGPTFKP